MGGNMTRSGRDRPGSLIEHVAGSDVLELTEMQETAWIEVIQKMDEVYADLIRYEVDLETKNTELEDAQRFITSVLTSMSDILIVCDSDGRVLQVNAAVRDLTGLSEKDLLGRYLRDILAPDYRDLADGFCPSGTETEVRDREVRFLARGDGESDPVAVNCTGRVDPDGQQAGAVIIGRPIGELLRAYDALAQAHKNLQEAQAQLVQSAKMASVGRLVAGVAHELNNPTSFVYGNVHTLERYGERLARYLEAIQAGRPPDELAGLREELRIERLMEDLPSLIEGTKEGAERIRDITRSLRRLSFAGDPGEHESFDLARAIETAVKWAVKGRKTVVPLDMDLPDEMRVRGNEGQIQQVIVNLVENALDAIECVAAPRLQVAGELAGNMAVVKVRDTGPGIGEDDLLKVFDPFFTTKAVGQGMGLGLWISYDIIKGHGGTIEASNAEDGGAIFTVSLPRTG